MFENELSEKFKRIFQLNKVSYAEPGESREQECLFVDVSLAKTNFKDRRVFGKVEGQAVFYAQSDKVKFGFFAKQIANADPNDTKDLFFSDFEENSKTYLNLVQRSFSFVYFFNSQYDPDIGTITGIEFTEG